MVGINDIDRNIGIYKITSPSGKVYIGESGNLKKRKNDYKRLSCKSQIHIYNSLKKYGWENHKFEVIGNCLYEDLKKLEYLIVMEYIDLLGERNVMTLQAGGGEKYYMADEIRDKISNTLKGRYVGELNPNYGRKHTVEEREKMSDANIGRILTQEIRDKISTSMSGDKNHFYGKKHSEEVRKLQSDVKKGKKCSEERKNKLKIKINQYDKNGKFIKIFPSVIDIEEFYNKDMSAIPRVCKGNQKTAYSFIWRYHSEYPECKDLIL